MDAKVGDFVYGAQCSRVRFKPELPRDIVMFYPVRLVKQGKWAKNSITSPEERGTRAKWLHLIIGYFALWIHNDHLSLRAVLKDGAFVNRKTASAHSKKETGLEVVGVSEAVLVCVSTRVVLERLVSTESLEWSPKSQWKWNAMCNSDTTGNDTKTGVWCHIGLLDLECGAHRLPRKVGKKKRTTIQHCVATQNCGGSLKSRVNLADYLSVQRSGCGEFVVWTERESLRQVFVRLRRLDPVHQCPVRRH